VKDVILERAASVCSELRFEERGVLLMVLLLKTGLTNFLENCRFAATGFVAITAMLATASVGACSSDDANENDAAVGSTDVAGNSRSA
jgi:hypothetical protein